MTRTGRNSANDPKRTFVLHGGEHTRSGPGSLAGHRRHPEHARLVDSLHKLGAVLVTDVPELVPFDEAFGRPVWVLTEHLVPFLERFLFEAELAQRIIPAKAAATVFATVMAVTNFAGSGSEAFGGWLFEVAKASYGRGDALSLVFAVSVAAAVSCWLLIPSLRRAAPQWWD